MLVFLNLIELCLRAKFSILYEYMLFLDVLLHFMIDLVVGIGLRLGLGWTLRTF